MQAFTIRQLKNNPSTVIRAAEADAMAVVTNRDQPTALVVALDRLGVADTAAVRSGLALTLIQSGSVSTAAAARIAGLELPRFLELLSSLKIPLTSSDPADTRSDLEAARRWLGLDAAPSNA
jgi:predicted HTH domain antitoxin